MIGSVIGVNAFKFTYSKVARWWTGWEDTWTHEYNQKQILKF